MQINSGNFTGGKLAAELLLENHCEVFIHINNDYTTIWPSFKRIVGFECLMEGQTYERVIRRELSEPFLPSAAQAMKEIVEDLLLKYKGRKYLIKKWKKKEIQAVTGGSYKFYPYPEL